MNPHLNSSETPQPINVKSKHCPSHSVLDIISGKWSVLALYVLKFGPLRYSALQRSLEGISQKMLTQTLRELERDGLLERTVYPVVPPHTDYRLTALGHSIENIMENMSVWAERNMSEVLEARGRYDGVAVNLLEV